MDPESFLSGKAKVVPEATAGLDIVRVERSVVRLRFSAVLVVVVISVTGCTVPLGPDIRVDMTTEALIGVWKNRKSSGFIVFSDDGEFVADGLPYEEFDGFPEFFPPGFDKERDSIHGSGEWVIAPSIHNTAGPSNHVKLHFQELLGENPRFGTSLVAEHRGDDIVLAFYLGDPDMDIRYVYHKASDGQPTGTPTR